MKKKQMTTGNNQKNNHCVKTFYSPHTPKLKDVHDILNYSCSSYKYKNYSSLHKD